MVKLYRPSDKLIKQYEHLDVLYLQMKNLILDFSKGFNPNNTWSPDQETIDYSFAIFILGVTTALQVDSNFNKNFIPGKV